MKYALYPNTLKTQNKGSYLARVRTDKSVNLDDIIEQMSAPGSGIMPSEALGAVSMFFDVLETVLREGHRVNLPLMKIMPSIKGQFMSLDDRFDPNRHSLTFNFTQGEELKKMALKIKPKKTKAKTHVPAIIKLIDFSQQATVTTFKPGMLIEIHGRNLVLSDDDDTGVYLCYKGDSKKISFTRKVGPDVIVVCLPKELPDKMMRLKMVVRLKHHVRLLECYSGIYEGEQKG